MHLDVKVKEAFGGEFAGVERSMLAAGEIPSEPGGVEARPIPSGPGNSAQEMSKHFVALAGNGIR
jgi:hypothetical protein